MARRKKTDHQYANKFSQEALMGKIGAVASDVGSELLLVALKLFYAWKSDDTPAWAKVVVAGALGYFIMPFDVIPDIIPVMGYTDDIAVMTGALASIAEFIDNDVELKARKKLKEWVDVD